MYTHLIDLCPSGLELALEKVLNHLTTSDVRRLPQGRNVEGTRQAVGEAKEQHGRDPATSVLKSEASFRHLVLLDLTTAQVVDRTLGISLGLVLAGDVSLLLAVQDVEVVVGGMAAGVALSADRSTEDNQVLRDRGVDDVHGAHGATGIVEDPVLLDIDDVGRQLRRELVDDVLDGRARVVAVVLDTALVQVRKVV